MVTTEGGSDPMNLSTKWRDVVRGVEGCWVGRRGGTRVGVEDGCVVWGAGCVLGMIG